MRRLTPSLRWGIGLCAGLGLVALLAPWIAPYDPAEQLDPAVAAYRPPGTVLPAVHFEDGSWRLAERAERTPGGLRIERRGTIEELAAADVLNLTPDGVADRRRFLLGSDKFGRDIASRMLYGSRVSLAVALLSAILALTAGIAVGAAAALGGRWLDALLMRSVDGLLAIPTFFLVIALVTFFQPDTVTLVGLLAGITWPTISRLARAEILGLRQREFVVAARALGQHPFAVFWRHLLPNAFAPMLIQATLLVGIVILTESSLSFLGLGIQPPTPSWGNMVSEGREALSYAWWVATFPGLAIVLTVVAFNLLGEGLRDTLDPHDLTPS
jgi:peptide/nickel transport system permease protein